MNAPSDRPSNASPEAEVFAAGFLIVRSTKSGPEILLMKHVDRWDLPKGHLEAGETFEEGAKRELEEETGILESELWVDPDFVFNIEYDVRERRAEGRICRKEVRIFLGWLLKPERTIEATEHLGHSWFPWSSHLRIQPQTIDPLLATLADHWRDGIRLPPTAM